METGYHCNRAETGQCRWRMSTGTMLTVFGHGSGTILLGRSIGMYVKLGVEACRCGCIIG